jgi:tRNA A-37 threonylcarbamoyl transferase component Bud32
MMKNQEKQLIDIEHRAPAAEVGSSFDLENLNERKELSLRNKEILLQVESIMATKLFFKNKINEGQQALIFKFEMETPESVNEDDRKSIEGYFLESKSLKVLKITAPELAKKEFEWQSKAFNAYNSLAEDEKGRYAAIPKPVLSHSFTIDEATREKLNRQNASFDTNEVSVVLMDWVEGEDLLTKLFRLYLSTRPAYKDSAMDKTVTFQSLLVAVNTDFRSQGMDFASMTTLEQYKKLLQTITRHNLQLLSLEQQQKIRNTIKLLHKHHIYHNDLHLRNFLISDGPDADVYLIDFGRADSEPQTGTDAIDDEFAINLVSTYKLDDEIDKLVDAEVFADIQTLIKRDASTEALINSMKQFSETELIGYLNTDSTQWRADIWKLRQVVAATYQIMHEYPDKASLVLEFLKDYHKNLPEDGKRIVRWLERQIKKDL